MSNPVEVELAEVAIPEGMKITPEPTQAEQAAIVTAYETLWQDPSEVPGEPEPSKWRFAGRWWNKEIRN